MDDREMLELAAKAVGMDLAAWEWHVGLFWKYAGVHDDTVITWNPRHRDGDSRCLQVALGMSLSFTPDHEDGPCWVASAGDALAAEWIGNHEGDSEATARMAVLRCAARVGKAMP